MKKGAVIIDISVDQGGCVETIRPTDLSDPVYQEHGVIHYGVCNMPAQTPRTSTMALTAATLPYISMIADSGGKALWDKPALRGAVTTYEGQITHQAVAASLEAEYKPFVSLPEKY